MVKVECNNCKIIFSKKPSHIAKSVHNYCSRKCAALARRNGKEVSCKLCGVKVYRSAQFLKKNKKFFCSRGCSIKNLNNRYGKNHPNWNGGLFSYRNLMENKRVSTCMNCGIEDKRMLVVHHIDGNRENNTIKNLVWLCYNCHHLVHKYGHNLDRYD